MRRLLALSAVLGALAGCGTLPRRSADPPRTRGEKIGLAAASWARRAVGRPYRFGGSSPAGGFDCSGLAWWAFKQAGLDIPETAAQQFRSGLPVSRSRLKPGDLVFFTTERRGPSHVGVYVGLGAFIHAPRAGTRVSKARLAESYWRARYLGARRYW